MTAGQRAQVKLPGERTRESALDTSPPANRPAAVSPMEGRGGDHDHSRDRKAPGADAVRTAGNDDSRRVRPQTTGQRRHSRPGTTASARAFHDASRAAVGRRTGHSHSAGSGERVNAAQARPTAPEPGNTSSRRSPGAAPSRSKIHRHTAAGLAPITRPGSVRSAPTWDTSGLKSGRSWSKRPSNRHADP